MRVPDSKSMPKFRPLPPIASAPISRITPDIEKNHFDAPMKSKRPAALAARRRRARRAARCSRERPIVPRTAWVAQHRGEQRDERADAEREGEALDPGRREDEQDERDHERHDVRVDDRREALACSPCAMPAATDLPAADLLLDAFEDDDVRVGRDADREDQARDARQRQRDRDELDQREQVDRVDDQRADRDHAEHAVEDEQEQRDDREADDARDQALVQRLLAERRRDLRLRDQLELDRQRAGLEQVRRGRWADWIVKPPRDLRAVARRRCRPGSAAESMYGTEISLLSSTIAKCWRRWRGSDAGQELRLRRAGRSRASSSATSCGPCSVKSNVTFGWPVPPAPLSKFCSGFLMSVPRSAGSSLEDVVGVGGRSARPCRVVVGLGLDDDVPAVDLDDRSSASCRAFWHASRAGRPRCSCGPQSDLLGLRRRRRSRGPSVVSSARRSAGQLRGAA